MICFSLGGTQCSATSEAEATVCINRALTGLYHNGVFIRGPDAVAIASDGLKFLTLYGEVAKLAHQRKVKRFPLFPKLHYLNHQFLDLLNQGRTSPFATNLLLYAVQMQEDFIGRPSRLSRRVNPRTQPLRVLQRTFIAIQSTLATARDAEL